MTSTHTSRQKIPRLSRSNDVLTSAQRWQAVVKRDATVDSFVYAVLTTKIYCRPSCSARLARRANVEFHDTPSQAENAGFRPCKRCRPQSGRTAAQSNPQTAIVYKACEQIRDELAAGLKPRLQDLAAQAGLTSCHFHRVFKKHTGVTPGTYASGLIGSNTTRPSSSPDVSTPDTLSEFETSHDGSGMERRKEGKLNLDMGDSLVPPMAGLLAVGSPMSMDPSWGEWNEFDILLAAESEQMSPRDVLSIDPRMLST
ncbi:Ada DNA repair metal-binding [Penicillium cosmopolitanum]|uniref:Ada DNA repair metal-binding n=1 Tax=Penicillium cosmopolitanum TaxID=1131564 RepID=A0A9W9VE93_9EURO|nr:Ada DNA repair metal-binding [Penicillium cosmopolitanum]KAJ5378777.1 Ada DNA repair metal-binding [Penicillium cosmopolitanum]